MENKQPIDLELEDINKSRGIPQELGDCYENFYNITRDISKEFLEKVLLESDPNKISLAETKSKFAESKEEEALPDLRLQNYHSSLEFDRLGLKKENSENIAKHPHKDI